MIRDRYMVYFENGLVSVNFFCTCLYAFVLVIYHFPGADAHKDPDISVGKRFASPRKQHLPRAKRAKRRETKKQLSSQSSSVTASWPVSGGEGGSRGATFKPVPASFLCFFL